VTGEGTLTGGRRWSWGGDLRGGVKTAMTRMGPSPQRGHLFISYVEHIKL